MARVLLLGCACVALILGAAGCSDDASSVKAIQATVTRAAVPPSVRATRWKLVQQVYREREYRPIWTNGAKLNGQARDLIETLCHAEREGLRASDYDLAGLRAELTRLHDEKDPAPEAIAALDLGLTQRFLDYGADLLAGRLDPQAVDNGWYIRARRAAIDTLLRTSLRSDDFDDMIEPLRPDQREYKEMVKALEDYREIQEKGGWPKVPGGTKLVRGSEGAAVLALRKRLDATDDLGRAGGLISTIYRRARSGSRWPLPRDPSSASRIPRPAPLPGPLPGSIFPAPLLGLGLRTSSWAHKFETTITSSGEATRRSTSIDPPHRRAATTTGT